MHGRSLSLWMMVLALAPGCGPTRPPDRASSAEPSAAPTVSVAPPAPSGEAIAAAPPSASLPDAPLRPPRFDADYCQADADCGWDDPCIPSRCQKRAEGAAAACTAARPATGSCVCAEKWCSLRPAPGRKDPSEGSCHSDTQCAIDVGAAKCVAVADARAVARVGPIDRQGPYCDCLEGSCQLRWAELLPCTSDAECWWERRGGRVKPARPDRPRRLPFRPCEDGEIDAVCSNGSCLVRGWSC